MAMLYEPDLPQLSPKGLPPVRDEVASATLEELDLMSSEVRPPPLPPPQGSRA